ncbi:MAG: preprotein translocase subunit SecB [Frankiales bacterium]|nr:preprotein translocase subunit SecB [Frankiales bacterium]
MSKVIKGATGDQGPPSYDQSLCGSVAGAVEIESIELVGAQFVREDDGPTRIDWELDLAPDIGIGVEWEVRNNRQLVVLTTFGTHFDPVIEEDGEPYSLVARFRLEYTLDGSLEPSPDEADNFAHWNAVFNAWPYWREYLSSTLNRSRLPQFVAPVMRIPRADD